jgi:AcrR family transcriptional regulator
MPHSTRSRTPSSSIESRLLDAAEEILENEGPDGLSVRRIAAFAEVAPMGVYNHFDGKSGIIDALFVRGFTRLGEALSTLDGIIDPVEALSEGGRRYRKLALEHPMSYRLMFLNAVPGYVPSAEAAKVVTEAFDGFVNAVTRASEAGLVNSKDPTLTAQILWAVSHGWVSLQICGLGFVDDVDAGADALHDAIWCGIADTSVT